MEADTKPSSATDPRLLARAVDALITAQTMEDAVRNISRPLGDIAEAFPILSAIDACLDKLAADVDPVIEEYQAADRSSRTDHRQDFAFSVNADLLDVLTLVTAAKTEAMEVAGGDSGADSDNMTSSRSRTASLLAMADAKVRGALRKLGPYA